MPKGKMRKAFYDNMLEFGITKEELEKNFVSMEKGTSSWHIFHRLYGDLVVEEIEWETGGKYDMQICACETIIEDLDHWIYNFNDVKNGKKINIYRIGSSCINRFRGTTKRSCLYCGKPYSGNQEKCGDCRSIDTQKQKEFYSIRCVKCKSKIIDRTRYTRCYNCKFNLH
tara:strand:- start:8 stop:517 length:510 start_codon:yes stop_codon:yes gene_type:complete